MSSRLPLLFFVSLTAALAGCASETSTGTNDRDLTEDQSAASSAKDPKAKAPLGAAEGEACGGKAAIACGPGLECKLSDATKSDSAGTCIAGVVTCLAMPSCDLGHEQVANESACAKGAGAVCYSRTLCKKTIWCTAALAPGR